MTFFQFVCQIRTKIDELFKLDVTFDLGRPAATGVHEVGGRLRREELSHFASRPATDGCRGRFPDGRDTGETALLVGSTHLATLFTLVARIQNFGTGETLKGRRHVGQRCVGGWRGRRVSRGTSDRLECGSIGRRGGRRRRTGLDQDFEANVFDRVHGGACGLAGLAGDSRFHRPAKERKGIFRVPGGLKYLLLLVVSRGPSPRGGGAIVVVVFQNFLDEGSGVAARFLHGINEEA
eukprot:scaffold1690_cov182-Amphora_coffeaeformis.AAC.46